VTQVHEPAFEPGSPDDEATNGAGRRSVAPSPESQPAPQPAPLQHRPALTATVVVCVYTEDRWTHILEAVDSVAAQDVSPTEVVVVVDHNPALLERLRSAQPDLIVVANEHGPGLSGARNTGVAHARGDVVVFLDDDARAEPGWLRALLDAYDDPSVVGVGGHVEPIWPGAAPPWLPLQFLWIVGCSYAGLPTSRAAIRNPIGANMSFRRSVFAEIGTFREGLGRQIAVSSPLGCEETEFGIRTLRGVFGSRILHEPSAVVQHHVPTERTSWRYFVRRCYAEGRSKAAVSRSVGAYHALAVERDYVVRILTRSAMKELVTLARERDATAILRVASLFVGVGSASVGYLRESVPRWSHWSEDDAEGPVITRVWPTDDEHEGLVEDGQPDVSVVVCTHLVERFGWLAECLDALGKQSTAPLEVVVVVDGPTEICRLLAERGGPEVVLRTPRPSGLSRARNVGISRAKGRCVAFLDDDAIPDADWLANLRSVLASRNVAGVSGLSEPLWEGDPPAWLPPELYWALGCSYEGMPTERTEVRNVFGGCACFDRHLFDRFGGFHPDLGRSQRGLAGCEETEFCVRVLRNDARLRFVHEPAAVIRHRVPRSRQRVSYIMRRCLDEGRSKAIFRDETAGFAGSLGRERTYVTKTVPRALGRDLRAAAAGDAGGLARSAILLGALAASSVSFLATMMRRRVQVRQSSELALAPILSIPPEHHLEAEHVGQP
jgi:glycosyltransferase involved in cell wall biosynthesis